MRKHSAWLLPLLLAMVSGLALAGTAQTVPEIAERRLERALRLASEPQRARELEALAREFPGTAIADVVRGCRLAQEGKHAEAQTALRAALAKDRSFAEAHHQFGLLFLGRGDFEAAREAFERATVARPRQPLYWRDLGRACRRLREPRRAVEAFRKALALDPRDVECEKFLAFALDEAGASSEALAQYGRAIRLDPRDSRLRAAYAILLERLDRKREAQQAYRASLDMNPREEMALTGLALLLAEQNHFPEALALVEKAIEQNPSDAQNYLLRARLYQRKGEFNQAEENYRRARDLDPANAFYGWQYGQFLESSGQAERAVAEYERGILSHPHQPMFYSSLVLLALRRQQVPQVLAWFQEVIARNPNVAELHAWTGYLYWEIAHLPEAEEEYARAAQLDPLNREYASMLAQIRERRRQEWRWYAVLFVVALAGAFYLVARRRAHAA